MFYEFRYIDDVFSLSNSRFGDFVDRVYPIELGIKEITDICDSYFDLHLAIGSEGHVSRAYRCTCTFQNDISQIQPNPD
jgi:hypothetical protein